MAATFIVNAPFVFSALWSVVKSFIDERTAKKIQIMGSSYQKALLEAIHAKDLPDFLGG